MQTNHLWIYSILILLLLSCADDDQYLCDHEHTSGFQELFDDASGSGKYDVIKSYFNSIKNDSVYITKSLPIENHSYLFEAENGSTLCVPDFFIKKVEFLNSEFLVLILLRDGSEIRAPFFNEWTELTRDSITINPYGPNPLCAAWFIEPPQPARLSIEVIGKPNGQSITKEYIVHEFEQLIPILGLYQDYENQVSVTFKSNVGSIFYRDTLIIATDAITTHLPIIEIIARQDGKLQEGLNFVSSRSHPQYDVPYAFDNYGEIRWILDYKENPILNRIFYDVGIERLKNGNWYFGDIRLDAAFEIGILGDIVNQWDLGEYDFHHKVQEKSSGNFLVTVSHPASVHLNGRRTTQDLIIEIDRTTGEIIHEWDLKESLDEYRTTFINNLANAWIDWIHVNAIYPDDSDNTIVISGRHQGVVKLTYDNHVKWILAPHKGWGTDRANQDLKPFLLSPLDAQGNPILDTMVTMGYQSHPDFEWNWGQHAIQRTASGSYILFDNGDRRNLGNAPQYSRVVEYVIDEDNMTIQQIWSYGKEQGRSCYSRIASNTEYHPSSNHFFMNSGVGVPNAAGNGGKTTEIDRDTQDILFQATISDENSVFAFHRMYRIPIYPE